MIFGKQSLKRLYRITQAILNAKQRYDQSKLANILYAKEVARRCPAIKTVSIHPRSVDTNNIYHMKKYLHSNKLIRCLFPILNAVYSRCGGELLTPDQDQRFQFGVQRAPTDILRNGEHYGCIRVPGKSSPYAHNIALALDLWDWT